MNVSASVYLEALNHLPMLSYSELFNLSLYKRFFYISIMNLSVHFNTNRFITHPKHKVNEVSPNYSYFIRF